MGELLGRLIELDVTNIAHGGVCVARHDGRVVFISDTVPGERVVARITDDKKKSFLRAETMEVLTPSEHRQEHVWDAASVDRIPEERAGGAEFGHIRLSHQRTLKAQILSESLERMAKLFLNPEVEAVAGDNERHGLGWRTRVSLHVAEDGNIGPFAARSHRVIPVTDLPLATAELSAAAPLSENFSGFDRVEVLHPGSGGVRLIVGKQKPQVITETVGNREFSLLDSGFWQVHHGAARVLTEAVQSAIDAELFDPAASNLDLYGGVGLFAAAVGDKFGPSTKITTVEAEATATDHAAKNLSEWLGARAETGRVDRWLRRLVNDATAIEKARLERATIVLDPPRSGAGREVVELVTKARPSQVVYVACDPVAFARDVSYFCERGYQLSSVRAFDLFPHTHHVEAIGTFTRA